MMTEKFSKLIVNYFSDFFQKNQETCMFQNIPEFPDEYMKNRKLQQINNSKTKKK